jgi:hypothetical protein
MPISTTGFQTVPYSKVLLYLWHQSNETLRNMQGWSSDDREMEVTDVEHVKECTLSTV